jgi:hypothetical protein
VITVERQVRADPDTVWGYVGRLADWAALLPTVDQVEPLQSDTTRIGSRYALRQPALPRLVYEVTEWVPGQRFTWVATAAGVRTVATHEAVPAGEGTRLRLGLRWDGPLNPLVRLLFTRRTRRYVELEAETFARLAEGERG